MSSKKKNDTANNTDIYIDNRSGETLSAEQIGLIEQVIVRSLELEEFTDPAEISVSIVDNTEIRELNKQYRGIDSATDVLSFPLSEDGERLPEDVKLPLGDIVISIEKAREQADLYGHSLERELGFLTVHSMLHLLGYDHASEEDEQVMNDKQEHVLTETGVIREL